MVAAIDPGRIGGPVVIPNCIMVRLRWLTPNGRGAFNVLHGEVVVGFNPTVAIANAILAALTSGAAWTALQPFLHTGTSLAGVDLLDMRAPSFAIVSSTGAASAGTGATVPMAPQTAICVTERTAFAGPSFRGRAYITGFSSASQQNGGSMSGGCQTALQNWAATWLTAFTASGLTLSIAQPHRAAYIGTSGTQHLARPANLVHVTQCVVRNLIWDTQRRRAGRS